MKTIQNKKSATAKLLMGIVSLSMVFSIGAAFIQPAKADDLSNAIAAKQAQINSTTKKIQELKSFIDSKQKEISSLNSQLAVIDSRVELIQLQLQSTQAEIEKTNAEIEKNENDIKQKEVEIEKQRSNINLVIREIYMEKDNSLLAVIVSSTSFSELVERTEYLTRIRAQLKLNIDKLNTLKTELEKQKVELDKKSKDLEQLKSDKQVEETGLEDQKAAKLQIMQATKGQESAYQSQLAKANAEEQAIASEITNLVQEQARRQREAAVAGREGREQVVNKGGFGYPLPGSNRISITGGDYMDPSYGMGFPHTGVDLAAKQGTPVLAAGAGTVLVAHDSGGTGLSYIAIDHGNGLVTKYLHVSAIYVKNGDIVNTGDTIGASGGAPGSHGAGVFTTGSHLHFEIDDYKGNSINPHNYLSILPPLF
ncbi:MAG TPA: peptidoglycan DD-metalloendopeptidase family protein [Patescibacteria group bacterium]|nr:peptidoglycan DD-metalloendopeptidase family protein [Patescibacteria group bacterium]